MEVEGKEQVLLLWSVLFNLSGVVCSFLCMVTDSYVCCMMSRLIILHNMFQFGNALKCVTKRTILIDNAIV